MADAVIEAEYHNFIHHIGVLKRYELTHQRTDVLRILISFWWPQVVDVVIEAQ